MDGNCGFSLLLQSGAMANSDVFDELSSRMSKRTRPDSGIHNSSELTPQNISPAKESSTKVKTKAGANSHSRVEEQDSGRGEDSDQADTGTATGTAVKGKSKFKFKNLKKIFKRKKKNSTSDDKLGKQYKAHSNPELLRDTGRHGNQHVQSEGYHRDRTNTEESNLKGKSMSGDVYLGENNHDAEQVNHFAVRSIFFHS